MTGEGTRGDTQMGDPRWSPPDRDAVIAELREWIAVLWEQAIALAHHRQVFREIFEMIQTNPHLPDSSTIYGWLKRVYFATATLAVRRLADDRRGNLSLYRLICKVRASPGVITRSWYLSQFTNLPRELASPPFDELAPGGAEELNPDLLRKELHRVAAVGRVVSRFADKYVAHTDEQVALRRTTESFGTTLEELDKSIDSLIAILRRYEMLIAQRDYGDHIPTPQDDWKALFLIPWQSAPPSSESWGSGVLPVG